MLYKTKKEFLDKGFHDDVYMMKRSLYHIENIKNIGPPKYPYERKGKKEICFDDYFTAFLVRARNLYRFFNNKTERNEAIVDDYISRNKIKDIDKKQKEMKEWYNYTNDRPLHLSYSRPKKVNVPLAKEIYKHLKPIVINFLKKLSEEKPEYISDNLKTLLAELN